MDMPPTTKDLRLALVQSDLHWENAVTNRVALTLQLEAIQEADIIILPEMFATGFTMNAAACAETLQGESLQWLQAQAAAKQCAVCGSLIIAENGKFYNRFVFCDEQGNIHSYNKRHLFRMGGEHHTYTAGTQAVVFSYKGWRICPQICYDLRFPVWSRQPANPYDLLLYVANWPQARRFAWRTLLRARAIENQTFVCAVNRVGTDGKGVYHSGDSAIIDFRGDTLAEAQHQSSIVQAQLSWSALQRFREEFPAWQDADSFSIAADK